MTKDNNTPTKEELEANCDEWIARFENELKDHRITLAPDSIKIWIKEYLPKVYYPKIQISYKHQQLQYDLTTDGYIREVNFRKFKTIRGKAEPITIAKHEANKTLQKIDTILYDTFLDPDIKEMMKLVKALTKK